MHILRAFGLLLLVAILGVGVHLYLSSRRLDPAPPTADSPGRPSGTASDATPAEVAPTPSPAVAAEATQREAVAAATTAAPAGEVVLAGRVVDEAGAAIAGARVRCTDASRVAGRRDAGDPRPAAANPEAVTDAQGVFRLPVGQAGATFFLRVAAVGHRVLDRTVQRPPAGETDLGTLALKRAAIVRGRVVDDAGAPVVGARVARESVRTGNAAEASPGEVLGDVDLGEFVPDDVPMGDFGAAEDADVPGAEFLRDVLAGRATTDVDGRFELAHCEPGEFALRARHSDHPSARRAGLSIAPGGVLDDVVIALGPGAAIRGRVVGAPEGIRALRVLAASPRPGAELAEGPFAGIGADVGEMMAEFGGMAERTVEVGADHTFALRGLHPGRSYRVWLAQRGRGFANNTVCSQRVEVAAPTEGLELRFDPGVTVTFQVVDHEGAPVENLWVRDQLRGGGGMSDLMAMAPRPGERRSYPEGRVALANLRPKPKQTLTLTVEALRCRAYERANITLPAAGGLDLGVVRLDPAPALEVTVQAKDTGAPVAGANVRVRAIERRAEAGPGNPFARMAGLARGASGPQVGRTDERGVCVVNVPLGGPIAVEVTTQDFAPYASEAFAPPVSGIARHAALLLRGGEVTTVVVDGARAALPAVRVQHAPPAGQWTVRTTERDGRAVFDRLAPGRHAFRIATRGGARAMMDIAAEMGGEAAAPTGPEWHFVEVVEGARSEVQLTPDPTATLKGIVRENGAPLSGARLVFLAGPGDGAADDRAEGLSSLMAEMGGGEGGRGGRTGDDGAFELKNLRAGAHRVRITAKSRAMPAVVDVLLQPGVNERDFDLDVAIVRGVVRGPDDQPIAGATVAAVPAVDRRGGADPMSDAMEQMLPGVDASAFGGAQRTVKSGDDGRYELRGVQPGASLRVRATARGFAAALSEPFVAASQGARDGVDVRLLAAGKLRVTLVDAPPFTSAQARLLDANGEPAVGIPAVAQVLSKGVCTLNGLRAGRWRVSLLTPGGGAPQTRVVDVVAGQTAEVAF